MKIKILFTEYEKYFAENLAAIIINNGGSAKLIEVITNGNYLIDHTDDYESVLIFPSIFLTYHTQSIITFLEAIIKLGSLEQTICLDYSNVNDLVNKNICKEALDFLEKKFKRIERIEKNVCLDKFFHKKIGVLNTSDFKYILLNGSNNLKEYNGNSAIYEPVKTFSLDSEFSFYDYIFSLEKVDFCLVNYDIKSNSIIYQISNYLNKPIVTADFVHSNVSTLNPSFTDFLLGRSKIDDEYINKLLNTNLIDRNLLDSIFIDLFK